MTMCTLIIFSILIVASMSAAEVPITLAANGDTDYIIAGTAAIIALSICLLSTSIVFAHGGGLDSQRGHNDNSEGNYHFHDGPVAYHIRKHRGSAWENTLS